MNEIMKISRHRMGSDGDGVSTLVAFFGCPLHCKYCFNDFCHDEKLRTISMTPLQLFDEVAIDDIYFRMTGGGIVFGGGEPLMNSDYIKQFIELSSKEWKYRIETSLNVEWEEVSKLISYIDQWIIDIKDINPVIYQAYTGVDNYKVMRNIEKLVQIIPSEKILFRIPHIKDYNSEDDIKKSCEFLQSMGKIETFEYIIFQLS